MTTHPPILEERIHQLTKTARLISAQVHVVRRVAVTLNRPWKEAVNASGTKITDDQNIHKVGNQYAATGSGIVTVDVVLLNYLNSDGKWDGALAWAQKNELKCTPPRFVLALAEANSKINGVTVPGKLTYVISTVKCSHGGFERAVGVHWNDSGRSADLNSIESSGSSLDWFSFVE